MGQLSRNPCHVGRDRGSDSGTGEFAVKRRAEVKSYRAAAERTARRTREQLNLYSPKRGKAPRAFGYKPLNSVWQGEDAELLEQMLRFYPRKQPKRILDATVNGGRFWRGSRRLAIGMDISIRYRPKVVGDNTRMPFRSGIFDVVVYDPPHIPNQGRDRSKDFNVRFGLVLKSPKEKGYSFSHVYPPFVQEAHRVLRPEGVLLCKITDYIHHHRYNWAHVDLMEAARAAGFRPCDCIIKVRKGPIIDPRWKLAHHSRRQHCYWLIFRKSEKCE
ncbi:MAG: class I SAM-dependent methyltransferase [Nitrososphaerales archaeon]